LSAAIRFDMAPNNYLDQWPFVCHHTIVDLGFFAFMEAGIVTKALPIPLSDMLHQAYKRRFSARRFQQHEVLFQLRLTTQHIENVATEWLEDTAGSPARWRILVLLLAAGKQPVPHQEIIAALQVKRATVSGLMRGLEQDGLVQSLEDGEDRRSLLATLTAKGMKVATQAFDLHVSRVDTLLKNMNRKDLKTLSTLLQRVHACFSVTEGAALAARGETP
jgi:DNA-binding MarR family transcriptional regulator